MRLHQKRPISSRLMHSPGVHSALKRSEYGSGKTPKPKPSFRAWILIFLIATATTSILPPRCKTRTRFWKLSSLMDLTMYRAKLRSRIYFNLKAVSDLLQKLYSSLKWILLEIFCLWNFELIIAIINGCTNNGIETFILKFDDLFTYQVLIMGSLESYVYFSN